MRERRQEGVLEPAVERMEQPVEKVEPMMEKVAPIAPSAPNDLNIPSGCVKLAREVQHCH